MKLGVKIYRGFKLISFFVYTFPLRLYRVPKSLIILLIKIFSFSPLWKIIEEFLSLLLLIIDLSGLPEIYDFITSIFKRNIRGLSPKENELLEFALPDTLLKKLIIIDENATLTSKRLNATYVSFFTINTYGDMPDTTFVHELIHVWQYSRFGSAYIVRALFAQNYGEGYDYGGIKNLMDAYSKKRNILDYNYEQQGEIIADYYKFYSNRNFYPKAKSDFTLRLYKYFIDQITNKKVYHW